MGFRYQRRIKIAKGMHLNISKSGVGMAVGPKGFGLSTGPRGTMFHAGINGTGMSYRSYLGTSSKPKSPIALDSNSYQLTFDGQNKVRIVSSNGEYLDDNNIIAKRIKRTDSYKNGVKELNNRAINRFSENTTQITEIFKHTPHIITQEDLKILLSCAPQIYEKKQFQELYPTEDHCKVLLASHPSTFQLFMWAFFVKSKDSYIAKNLTSKLNEEITRWNSNKADFDTKEDEQFQNIAMINKEMEIENAEIAERLKGDNKFIVDTIVKIIGEITLPVDFSINADYDPEKHSVYLDIDLPEIGTMPKTKASELSSGKLSIKDKTSKELKYDYCRCVTGMAFYLSGLAFNVSTEITKVIASGHSNRLSLKTGNLEDDYVYSVIFEREPFSKLVVENIDPVEAIKNFENKLNISPTFEMKSIQPFIDDKPPSNGRI